MGSSGSGAIIGIVRARHATFKRTSTVRSAQLTDALVVSRGGGEGGGGQGGGTVRSPWGGRVRPSDVACDGHSDDVNAIVWAPSCAALRSRWNRQTL